VYGYGGVPRRPLRGFPEDAGKRLWEHSHVIDLLNVEKELAQGGT